MEGKVLKLFAQKLVRFKHDKRDRALNAKVLLIGPDLPTVHLGNSKLHFFDARCSLA